MLIISVAFSLLSVNICLCLVDSLTLKFTRENSLSAHHNRNANTYTPLNCLQNMILLLYCKCSVAKYSVRSSVLQCTQQVLQIKQTKQIFWSDLREVSRRQCRVLKFDGEWVEITTCNVFTDTQGNSKREGEYSMCFLYSVEFRIPCISIEVSNLSIYWSFCFTVEGFFFLLRMH